MCSIVSDWLKEYAKNNNYKVYDAVYGCLDLVNVQVQQNAGAIYGIWYEAEKSEEVGEGKNIEYKNKIYEVLYWGKDLSVCSRIQYAHLKTPNGTGGLNLVNKPNLRNGTLYFGCIIVEKYCELEKELHRNYKGRYGSDRTGKMSKKIKVLG